MGLSSQTSDHDYCGVLPRLPEPSGRPGIEKSKDLHRPKIMSASIPENLLDSGSTRDSTNLAEPDMVPRVNSFVNEKSLTLTSQHLNPLKNGETHTLLQNQTMRLAAWIITGNIWLRKESQRASNLILA